MDSGTGLCWACEATGRLWCSNCRFALYCSLACLKKDRLRHLDECVNSSRRRVCCSYCGREEALGGVPCPECLVAAYCTDSCRKIDAKNHRSVCLQAKQKVVEAAKKIDEWNRRAKGIPQYLGRLIHAVDYLSWSENEGAKILAEAQSSQHKKQAGEGGSEADQETRNGEGQEGELAQETLRLLLLGADLKHVLCTLHNTPDTCTQGLEMVLVDSSPHILARDLLILYLLMLPDAHDPLQDPVLIQAHAEKVVMVFYSLCLDMETHALLCNTLHNLLNMTHADFLHEMRQQVQVDAGTYTLVQAVWNGWMSFANDPSALQKLEKVRSLKVSGKMLKEVLARYIKSCPKDHQKAVTDWIKRGSMKKCRGGNFPNVTLACFSPLKREYLDKFEDVSPKWSEETEWIKAVTAEDDMIYAPHGIDMIFQDWDFLTLSRKVKKESNVVEMYTIYLTEVFSRSSYKLLRSKQVSITFVRADVRDLSSDSKCLSGKFDRVATGIHADLLGTPYVLQHFGSLLRTDNIYSRLLTHHRVWSLCLDWRSDQQARETCLKSLKCNRAPDPLLMITGRWATFRHFLQAELLHHLHVLDGRPLEPENVLVFKNVSHAYDMVLSDYTRQLNHIVPFRFQADKRTVSMVDSRLHTLEWRRLGRTRRASAPAATNPAPKSLPSTPSHDADPACRYVDNLIYLSQNPSASSPSPDSRVRGRTNGREGSLSPGPIEQSSRDDRPSRPRTTNRMRPRSLYVSTRCKSPLLSPEFDFWEHHNIIQEKKTPTSRAYSEIPEGISRRIQQALQADTKQEKITPKSAPVSPELTRKTKAVKEKANAFERGTVARLSLPETRKAVETVTPSTPVKKLVSMFSKAFALKDKETDVGKRFKRSNSLHDSCRTPEEQNEFQNMSSTNSLRFNRSRSRTQTNGAMSKASECGMSTFPRMSRPHSIAGSKFSYLEGCPDKDQQLSSPISSSVTKYDIKKSTAVDTTDSPRNKKGHVSPIRSLIAGLNTVSLSPVSQQAAGHQGTTSPRDIIAIKREELRKVNLRPCSQRLPSPVSPLPSSEIKTANRPESPATEPSSSNMLDKNTFYRRRSSFESITEKESQSRKSPTPPPWKSALKKSIRKIPHEPEYLAPSLNKSQPASRPSPTSHSHKSQTWTTSSDQDENVKVKTPGSSESNCASTLSDVQRTSLPECIFSPRPTPGRGIRSICQPQSEGCLQSVRKKRSVMKIETSKADENSTTVSSKSDKSKTTSSSSKSDSRTPISPSSKSDSTTHISLSSKSDSRTPISPSSKSDSTTPISSSSKSDSTTPISSSSKSDSIPTISPSSKSDSIPPISSSSKSDSIPPISSSSKSDSTTPISSSSKSDSTTPISPSSKSDSTTPISLSSKSHSTRPISPSSKSDSTRPISPSSKSDSTTPISPSPVIKEEEVLADIILSPEDLMSPTSTSMSSSLTDADMEVLELLSHHEQFCPIQTFSPDTDDQSIVFILNQDVEGNINPEIESSRNETDIQKHFREDLLLPDDTDHTLCKISSEEDINLEYVDSDSGGQSPDVSEQRTPSVCRMIEHFAQRIQEQQELLERPPSPKRDIIRRIFLHQTKEMCSGSHDAKQALTPQSTEGSNGLIPDNIKIGTTNLETGTKENICESTPEPSRLLTHEDSKDEETLKTKTDVETDIQPTLSSPRLSLRLQAASVEEPSPNLVNKMVEQFDQQIQAQSLPTSPTSSRPNSIASLIQQDMLRLYTTQSKVARLNDDTIENPSPIGEDFFEETTFEIYDDDDKEMEDKSLEINNKIPSEPETSDSDDDVEATVQMGNQICVIPKRTVREIRPSVCDELRHEFLQKIRSLDDDLRSLEKKKYEERRNAMKDKRKDIQHEGKIVTDEFANVQSLYREPRPKDAKDVPYTELEDIEHIKDDSEYFPVSCSNEPTIALQVTQELTQLEPKNQTNSKISEDDTFTSNFSSSAYTEPRGSEDKNIEYSPTNSLQNKSVEHVIDSDESLHIMPTLKSSKTGGLDRLSFRNYVKSSIANETLVSESEQPSTCVLEHDTKVMEYTSSFEVSTDEYRADPESVEEAVEAISFLSSDDHRRSRMSQGFTFYTNESEVAEDQNCGDKYQATENKKHKYYTRRRTLPSVPSDIQHEDYDSHRGSSTASLRSCDDKECTDSMTAWEDDKDSFVIRGRAQARHSTQLHMRHVDEIKRCRHSDEKVFTYGTFDAPTETTKDVRRFTWGSLRRKKKQDYSKEKKEETKPGDTAYIKQDNLSSKVQSEKVNKGTAYNFFFDRKKNKFENDQFPGTPDNTRTNPSLYKNLTDSSSKDNTIPTIVSVLPKQRENEPTDVDSHFGRERQTYRSKMASELKPKLKKRIPFYRDSSSSSDNFSQSLLRLIAPAALEEKQLLSGGEDSPSIQGEASEVSEGEQNYSPEYPSSACVRSRDPWVRRDLQDTMVESASLSDEADVFSNDVSSSNDEISQVNHNGGVEVRPRAGVLKTGRDRSRDSRRSLRVSWGDLPERMDSPSQISDAEDHDDDNNDDYHEQDEHQQTQEHGPDKQDEKAYRVTQL